MKENKSERRWITLNLHERLSLIRLLPRGDNPIDFAAALLRSRTFAAIDAASFVVIPNPVARFANGGEGSAFIICQIRVTLHPTGRRTFPDALYKCYIQAQEYGSDSAS